MTKTEQAQYEFRNSVSEEVRDLLAADIPGGIRDSYFVDSASPPGDLLATPANIGKEYYELDPGTQKENVDRTSELLEDMDVITGGGAPTGKTIEIPGTPPIAKGAEPVAER